MHILITPGVIAVCSCLLLAPGGPAEGQESDQAFDPFTGYRITHYRAPIPSAPKGVPIVSTQEVLDFIAKDALLVDVHPLRNFHIAEDGTWIYPEPHLSLPGVVWLPVVGWGVIEPWAEAYLRAALAELASQEAPVVIFCQLDCWLSWNAVQRIRDLGFEARWYPGGIDDWQAAGYDLLPVTPHPFQE